MIYHFNNPLKSKYMGQISKFANLYTFYRGQFRLAVTAPVRDGWYLPRDKQKMERYAPTPGNTNIVDFGISTYNRRRHGRH